MKLTIYFVLLLALSSFGAGVSAGDEYTVHVFSKCHSLTVNVSATQQVDDGEYWFKGCTERFDNSSVWDCDCHDGYELVLETSSLTVNNYTINIDYTYKVTRPGGGSSGGSGGVDYYQVPYNDSVVAIVTGTVRVGFVNASRYLEYRGRDERSSVFRISGDARLLSIEPGIVEREVVGGEAFEFEVLQSTSYTAKLRITHVPDYYNDDDDAGDSESFETPSDDDDGDGESLGAPDDAVDDNDEHDSEFLEVGRLTKNASVNASRDADDQSSYDLVGLALVVLGLLILAFYIITGRDTDNDADDE